MSDEETTPRTAPVDVPPWSPRRHHRPTHPLDADTDDATLLAAVIDGPNQQAAMTLLHDRHAPAVRAVCTNQLRTDRHSIDDLVQDVFVLLHRHAATITDPHRLRHWLRKTAVNTCANHRTRAHKRHDVPLRPTTHGATPPRDFTDAIDDTDQARRLLGRLPATTAALLDAHYLREMTLPEIAHSRGTTTRSVTTQLSTARAHARRTAHRPTAA